MLVRAGFMDLEFVEESSPPPVTLKPWILPFFFLPSDSSERTTTSAWLFVAGEFSWRYVIGRMLCLTSLIWSVASPPQTGFLRRPAESLRGIEDVC